jgi:hypothetical protein
MKSFDSGRPSAARCLRSIERRRELSPRSPQAQRASRLSRPATMPRARASAAPARQPTCSGSACRWRFFFRPPSLHVAWLSSWPNSWSRSGVSRSSDEHRASQRRRRRTTTQNNAPGNETKHHSPHTPSAVPESPSTVRLAAALGASSHCGRSELSVQTIEARARAGSPPVRQWCGRGSETRPARCSMCHIGCRTCAAMSGRFGSRKNLVCHSPSASGRGIDCDDRTHAIALAASHIAHSASRSRLLALCTGHHRLIVNLSTSLARRCSSFAISKQLLDRCIPVC